MAETSYKFFPTHHCGWIASVNPFLNPLLLSYLYLAQVKFAQLPLLEISKVYVCPGCSYLLWKSLQKGSSTTSSPFPPHNWHNLHQTHPMQRIFCTVLSFFSAQKASQSAGDDRPPIGSFAMCTSTPTAAHLFVQGRFFFHAILSSIFFYILASRFWSMPCSTALKKLKPSSICYSRAQIA